MGEVQGKKGRVCERWRKATMKSPPPPKKKGFRKQHVHIHWPRTSFFSLKRSGWLCARSDACFCESRVSISSALYTRGSVGGAGCGGSASLGNAWDSGRV